MECTYPHKVLLTGGHPFGGVTSFAEGLRTGFLALGIPAEVIPPRSIASHGRQLLDPRILKILSTTAVFAAPLARRAICIAHGFPCAKYQGWLRTLAILASYRLATASLGAQLAAVSEYSALHLRAIFGLRVDAVIHNPVLPLFIETPLPNENREAITYVGRLHNAKNVDRLLPAMRDLLDENPGLRAWIIGDGAMRPALQRMAAGDRRIEFLGPLAPQQVRERLARSRVFVSANPTEPFGIVYLEALGQGCAVAMPASGGGLEIAPELIGSRIHLFPATLAHQAVASALRKALLTTPSVAPLDAYSPRAIAEAYLAADSRFSPSGTFQPEAIP